LPEADPESHLHVEVRHRAGGLHLALEFVLDRPWTVLFGPSGSGKTTILRLIAGLLAPDAGTIVRIDRQGAAIESRVMFDCSEDGIHLDPYQRLVGFAPQQAWLFPHLTVRDNLLYGLRYPPYPSQVGSDATLAPIAKLFRIPGLLNKRPGELSGGEAQRVNLARACVTALRPAPNASRILLLDEPLTGLDLRLRDEIAADLKLWTRDRGLLVLSVTHDVGEVFQLGAGVLRLDGGTIVQRGPALEVLGEERTRLLHQLQSP
jgi:molybdate transport system ATP-binding protein